MDTQQTTEMAAATNIQQSLEQKSTQIIDWLDNSIRQTSNFVTEQTPQFIQELLQWNFYSSLTVFVLGIVLLGIFSYLVHLLLNTDHFSWKNEEVEYYKRNAPLELDNMKASAVAKRVVLFAMMLGSFLFGVWGSTNTDWFKISVSPRVYLLEYGIKNIKK